MSALFDARYSHTGRPSVAPEKLLRALLLQVLYTVRSERQLMEQLDYNLLFRWFVGLGSTIPPGTARCSARNRDRLLPEDIAREFFRRVLMLAEWQGFHLRRALQCGWQLDRRLGEPQELRPEGW